MEQHRKYSGKICIFLVKYIYHNIISIMSTITVSLRTDYMQYCAKLGSLENKYCLRFVYSHILRIFSYLNNGKYFCTSIVAYFHSIVHHLPYEIYLENHNIPFIVQNQ